MSQIDFAIFEKLVKFCNYRERNILEVTKKAEKLNLNKTQLPVYIELLKKEGFLDSARYLRAFIHDHLVFNKWGWGKIFSALFLIYPKENINKIIIENPKFKTIYFDNMLYLLDKKKQNLLEKTPDIDSYTLKIKLFNYLYQKGYLSEDINKALA